MPHTHDLTFAGAILTKRYTSWDRGEHVREWTVLQQIHRDAPGLAPRPVSADLASRPPAVTMSVVPGAPLTATVPTAPVAAAIGELWRVSHDEPWRDDLAFARRLTDGPRPPGGILAEAHDAARDWWRGPDPEVLRRPPAVTVLGHRDPNLDNYLWDGHRVRIVDFEDATTSDPATELAILMEHRSWREVDTGPLRALLAVDEQRLAAARRLWAMFWLWLLRPGGRSAARNHPGVGEEQARRLLDLL
ncbi:phosphotransferase [Paractinoplanes maris]|uniref:phosphotransferase n=1 Tax=Paractinoplanes maris TaxID=1734446 RepID=UPI002020C626|nr:phosphotransferase [Actinoplanes maris]